MSYAAVSDLLGQFQHFGINLGLSRIQTLLNNLRNPQNSVVIAHVAGTNGKGSVCAYLSSILKAADYKVGRFTSPHLVSWTERMCINNQQISAERLLAILETVKAAIAPEDETPTQFEIITAAAFVYFAQEKVDIAVIEVGLGGRLDSTNVCDRPLVSVITSIGMDHWQRLGKTLDKIAGEKAGVLKQDCPAVIGEVPEIAAKVIQEKAESVNCPATWIQAATRTEAGLANYQGFEYDLPLLGDIQLHNSAIAIEAIYSLRKQGWQISDAQLREGIAQTSWAGRIEWRQWKGQKILIDGAHNGVAAEALRDYVDGLSQPVTWVMGMLSTKDHQNVFRALLREKDTLHLVPVGGHSSAKPSELGMLAQLICPGLKQCLTHKTLPEALDSAIATGETVVLCGSLYLLGEFLGYEAKI
ncbi:FolC bifunctional protein [[Leptolyngbya] sp. PCC 7376]|uniref:bifunctional folylpolyglutamate synthase/dihydrofolate synthase n=1 Tax=[Leptolyngbya] sp. PCC 7376 TaxID=111781 RepID=UPI00029EF12D|nr:folylpolyglutamate synthase/dihydrofolate synthase family protein [[Leptolyngbya] sp. PCC 7376]AFY39021.1 FolC bifunctional protein [[Leptolyngbya] sp. PCC 7376]